MNEKREVSSMDFLDVDCIITHVKHLNDGGESFPSIEYMGLYPNWDCNKWNVELIYHDKKVRPFEIYTPVEMGEPDLNDVLTLIFDKDYINKTLPQFIANNEYVNFFKEYGKQYSDVDSILDSLWWCGMRVRGLLYKLIGKNNFYELKKFLNENKY